MPLARATARRAAKWLGIDRDDAIGVAYLALCEAAKKFDPGRNRQFASFARRKMWWSLLLAAGDKVEKTETLDVEPIDYSPSPEDVAEAAECKEMIAERGFSKKLARDVGIDLAAASMRMTRARKLWRKQFEPNMN